MTKVIDFLVRAMLDGDYYISDSERTIVIKTTGIHGFTRAKYIKDGLGIE